MAEGEKSEIVISFHLKEIAGISTVSGQNARNKFNLYIHVMTS